MALWLAWRFGWRWRGVGCWRRGVGCWSLPCAVSRMQRVRIGWHVVYQRPPCAPCLCRCGCCQPLACRCLPSGFPGRDLVPDILPGFFSRYFRRALHPFPIRQPVAAPYSVRLHPCGFIRAPVSPYRLCFQRCII